jgi:hypothetical protein
MAVKELENCIDEIRRLPGFGSFQMGLTAEQMKNASMDGSIIVVNITILRSDAIVVSPTGFKVTPLTGLDSVQAQKWIDQGLTATSQRKNKDYRQFLAWLWHECVRPVLDEHQYLLEHSIERLPRVWWIGTGLASSFPFHAAGDISVGLTENAYCRVLSSYTPSIKALTYARERVSTTGTSSIDPPKLLIIAMANTPDAKDLPGVMAETSAVEEALGTSIHATTLSQPPQRLCVIFNIAVLPTSPAMVFQTQ